MTKVFFGVGSGLARYFAVDATLFRIAIVALCLANGIGLVLYVVLAIVSEGLNQYQPTLVQLANGGVLVIGGSRDGYRKGGLHDISIYYPFVRE